MVQSVVDLFQQLARNEFGFFSRLNSVSEIMLKPVPSVSSDLSLGDVLGRRNPLECSSCAVIDNERKDLIGVLQHSTILRCLPRYLNTLKETDRDRHILTTNVCDLVTRRLPHIRPTARPLEALEIIIRQGADFIPVYDDPQHLAGVITPGCFARTMLLYYRVFQQMQPLQRLRLVDLDSDLSLDEIFCRGAQTARDVMSSPVTLPEREPVASAVQLFSENSVRHLPLTGESGSVTSVLTRNDILSALNPPVRPGLVDHTTALASLSELLSTGQEAVLAEPVSNLARGRLITVAPTARLAETLLILAENEREAVLVIENNQLFGIVTLSDIVRIFRTLMRLKSLKENN